jgi:SAM-dependent methyltransferase
MANRDVHSALSLELAQLQHDWLRGARYRLLRAARIAHRRDILEVGAGWGLAAEELADRSGRRVTAVDISAPHVDEMKARISDKVDAVTADVCQLPFADESFDLVFSQFAFLWFADTGRALGEIRRVLRSEGAIVAIEPDYGGMIEYPLDLGLRELWIRALDENGAYPYIGRQLAVALRAANMELQIGLPERIEPHRLESLEFMRELLVTPAECRQLDEIAGRLPGGSSLVHLPLFMLLAADRQDKL